MNKIVHDIGLDVHKDSIAVSVAPQGSAEVRCYGMANRPHIPATVALNLTHCSPSP
jgi:hypothetical protein